MSHAEWRGTHPTVQSITGLNQSPDLVWIKDRSGTNWHYIFDTIRGVNQGIFSNAANPSANYPNSLTSFDSDGFTLGSDNACNNDGSLYVGWGWKAGGSAGTFNIDDVDVGSAANAKMNDGGLNNEVYNQDYVWSSNYSGNNGVAPTPAFDPVPPPRSEVTNSNCLQPSVSPL